MALNESNDRVSSKDLVTDRDHQSSEEETLVNKTHINNVFDTSTINID